MSLNRDDKLNKDTTKKGMFDLNGRVRAQAFRGEKSEGFWVPVDTVLAAFFMTPGGVDYLKLGSEFDYIGETMICKKYVSPATMKARNANQGPGKKKKEIKMFLKHFSTPQFGRNDHAVLLNDYVIITEKLHGTSQRVGNILVTEDVKLSGWQQFCGWLGDGNWTKSVNLSEYKDLIGTRNVVLNDKKKEEDSGFHPVSFREKASELLLGNMRKGETFFYEVVGYEPGGKSIMPTCENKKLKKHLEKEEYKKFMIDFGNTTTFNYGCKVGEFKVFVYRITMTNEDGVSVDYTWDAVKTRCSELGISNVPELFRGTRRDMAQIYAVQSEEVDGRLNFEDDELLELSARFIKEISEGRSIVGSNLIEGVCLRIENDTTPTVFKEKNFQFKVLEGIIKDSGVIDEEEAQSE